MELNSKIKRFTSRCSNIFYMYNGRRKI